MMAQRWDRGQTRWRSTRECIRPREYDVAIIPGDNVARDFVVEHHYARSFPSARVRVGLYRHGTLVGVAVFSVPARKEVLTHVFPDLKPYYESLELGRFVLHDEVPGNGESWFLARAFALLRQQGVSGVVSFSDPLPRATLTGAPVFAGHIGTIYQASNARYLGRSTPDTLLLLPDGVSFPKRSRSKIRHAHRGWRSAVTQLVRHGADELRDDADEAERVAWLKLWDLRLVRRMRHPGNHRYAFGLDRRVRSALPVSGRYPKNPETTA